jgi:uncharacterized protein (UPF0332 family)
MNEKKSAAIELKLTKAKLLLDEISILQKHKINATIINRLYYACYHATKALLLTKDLIPKTHSGVISLLHKHFVNEGSFDAPKAAFFNRLLQERMDDDYSDLITVDDETVEEFHEPAKEYFNYIIELIHRHEHQ